MRVRHRRGAGKLLRVFVINVGGHVGGMEVCLLPQAGIFIYNKAFSSNPNLFNKRVRARVNNPCIDIRDLEPRPRNNLHLSAAFVLC